MYISTWVTHRLPAGMIAHRRRRATTGRPRGRVTEIVSSLRSANLTSDVCALSRWNPSRRPFASTTSI